MSLYTVVVVANASAVDGPDAYFTRKFATWDEVLDYSACVIISAEEKYENITSIELEFFKNVPETNASSFSVSTVRDTKDAKFKWLNTTSHAGVMHAINDRI